MSEISGHKKIKFPFSLGERSFQPKDAPWYLGRRTQSSELMMRFRRSNFLTLVGPKGSGKSSLVNCGLIGKLNEDNGIPGPRGRHWRVARFRPGASPISSLARALVKFYADGVEFNAEARIEKRLRRDFQGLRDQIHQIPEEPGTNLLLVIDQFEDVFDYKGEFFTKMEVNHFISLIVNAIDLEAEQPRVKVLLVLDSEKVQAVFAHPGLYRLVNDSQLLLPSSGRAELKELFELYTQHMTAEKLVPDKYFISVGAIAGLRPDLRSLYTVQYIFKRLQRELDEGREGTGISFTDDWRNIRKNQLQAFEDRIAKTKKILAAIEAENKALLQRFGPDFKSKPQFKLISQTEKELLVRYYTERTHLKTLTTFFAGLENLGPVQSSFVGELEEIYLGLQSDRERKAVEILFRESLPIKDRGTGLRPVTKKYLLERTGMDEKEFAQIMRKFGPQGIGVFEVLPVISAESHLDGIEDMNEEVTTKVYLADFVTQLIGEYHLDAWFRYREWEEEENYAYGKLKELHTIYENRDVKTAYNEIRGHRLETLLDWYRVYGKEAVWGSRFPEFQFPESVAFLEQNYAQKKKEDADEKALEEGRQRDRSKRNKIILAFGIVAFCLGVAAIFLAIKANDSAEKANDNAKLAERRRKDASISAELAEKRQKEAEEKRREADTERTKAFNSREAAKKAQEEAEESFLVAEGLRKEAVRKQREADILRRDAVKEKNRATAALAELKKSEKRGNVQRMLKQAQSQARIVEDYQFEPSADFDPELKRFRDTLREIQEVISKLESDERAKLKEKLLNPRDLMLGTFASNNDYLYRGLVSVSGREERKKDKNDIFGAMKFAQVMLASNDKSQLLIASKSGNENKLTRVEYSTLKATPIAEDIPQITSGISLPENNTFLLGGNKGEVLKITQGPIERTKVGNNRISGMTMYQGRVLAVTRTGKVLSFTSDMKKPQVRVLQEATAETVQYDCIAVTGSLLFAGGKGGILHSWVIQSDGSLRKVKPVEASDSRNVVMAQSRDYLFVGDVEGKVVVYRISDFEAALGNSEIGFSKIQPVQWIKAHKKGVEFISANNEELIIGGGEGKITYWELDRIEDKAYPGVSLETDISGMLKGAYFGPHGRFLTISTKSGFLWEPTPDDLVDILLETR